MILSRIPPRYTQQSISSLNQLHNLPFPRLIESLVKNKIDWKKGKDLLAHKLSEKYTTAKTKKIIFSVDLKKIDETLEILKSWHSNVENQKRDNRSQRIQQIIEILSEARKNQLEERVRFGLLKPKTPHSSRTRKFVKLNFLNTLREALKNIFTNLKSYATTPSYAFIQKQGFSRTP